jgi:hypothetical protein
MDPIVVIPMKDYVVGHVIANSVVQFLVVLVVCARFVSRIKFGSGVGTDDWLILAATVSFPILLRKQRGAERGNAN